MSLPPQPPTLAQPDELPTRYDWAGDDDNETHHLESVPASAEVPLHYSTSAETQRSNGTNTSKLNAEDKVSSTLRKTRSALGLHPDAPIDDGHDIEERQKLLWSKIRITFREPFAEFWGTLIMVMFGDGSVAQVLLSSGQTTAPGGNGFGAYQSISWG